MKKILCIILIFGMLLLPCCGSKIPADFAMSYKGRYISKQMYSYWLSTYKTQFIDYYNNSVEDPGFWEKTTEDGRTYKQYVEDFVSDHAKQTLVSLYLFDTNKLKLSAEKTDEIEADIAEKIEYNDGEKGLNERLARYGMDVGSLREVYIAEAEAEMLTEYLYGENGIDIPDENKIAEYFKDNYVSVKMITIYTVSEYKKDENGALLKNDDGEYIRIRLDGAESSEKFALVEKIKTEIGNGRDFDSLRAEYSEEDYSDHPDGIFLSKNESSVYGSGLVDAALALEEGETTDISDGMATYIIKKIKLTDYRTAASKDPGQLEAITERCREQLINTDLRAYFNDITVNDETIDSFDFGNVSRNTYF
ncbi:MAG: hypothetical protein IJT91_03205 [Clostridia bacterium]|nr:hypothetical protein [Clostridia bacterium]